MSRVLDAVTAESVLQWIVIAAVVAFFVYKELPGFYRRVTDGAVKEQKRRAADEDAERRIARLESRVDDLDRKLASDYDALAGLKRDDERSRRMLRNSLEEREIIMRALLGIIGGLQEMGADGPTKEAQTEITDYLARQAHRDDTD